MPTSVEEQYKCTAADVAVRAASEAAVGADRPADVAKLGAYLAYIRLETVTGEPSRVQASNHHPGYQCSQGPCSYA